MPTGKLNRDLTVGAKNDVNLKSGQTVQVLGKSGSKVVIMVTLADGSNGVFQVDAADVAITAAAPPPAGSRASRRAFTCTCSAPCSAICAANSPPRPPRRHRAGPAIVPERFCRWR